MKDQENKGVCESTRKRVVEALYPLGISAEALARWLEVSSFIIRKDIQSLGIQRGAIKKEVVFTNALRSYLLHHESNGGMNEIIEKEVLGLPSILKEIEAWTRLMEAMATPDIPEEKMGYCRLLNDIVGLIFREPEWYWWDFVREMEEALRKEGDQITSREELMDRLANWFKNELYLARRPPWPLDFEKSFVKLFPTISSSARYIRVPIPNSEHPSSWDWIPGKEEIGKEEIIIRAIYGIGQERKTLAQIGKGLGCSGANVARVRDNALRKLRHPSRSQRLRPLSGPLPINWEQEQQKREKERECKERRRIEKLKHGPLCLCPEGDPINWEIDDLELSCRAARGLRDAEITTISDLVEKTEGELLKIKNFGKVSLNEIKEILAELGLSLRDQ